MVPFWPVLISEWGERLLGLPFAGRLLGGWPGPYPGSQWFSLWHRAVRIIPLRFNSDQTTKVTGEWLTVHSQPSLLHQQNAANRPRLIPYSALPSQFLETSWQMGSCLRPTHPVLTVAKRDSWICAWWSVLYSDLAGVQWVSSGWHVGRPALALFAVLCGYHAVWFWFVGWWRASFTETCGRGHLFSEFS